MCPAGDLPAGRAAAAAVLAALLVMSIAARAAAQSAPKPGPQEESRRKLLEQMGLEKQQPRPADAAPPAAPEPPPPPAAPAPTPTGPPAPPAPPVVPFAGRVHELLLGSCRVCHASGGLAAATRLVLDGSAAHDHAAARRLADTATPRRSLLLTKATGNQHGGGPTIAASSETYRRLLQWIGAGAALQATPAAAAAGAPAPSSHPRPARPRPQPAPIPAAPPDTAAPAPPAGAPLATAVAAPAAEAAPPPTALALHGELVRACLPCHREGGPAVQSRYRMTGQLVGDLLASRAFVDAGAASAADTLLASKAAGQAHGGGAPWPPDSAGRRALAAWIAAGAPDGAPPAVAPAPATPAAVAQTPPPAAVPPPVTAAPHPTGAAPHGQGLRLFGDTLTLNGRFDVNLERRAFQGNPWGDGSKTALESYHHFLFLARQSTEDPFLFTAEVVNLTFYEAGLRLHPPGGPWRANVRAGKLLVPFGNEPLFHQAYGGHVGFDQRVLPPVWSAEGAAASGSLQQGPVTASADLYGVRGYSLRRPDAALNLQSDLSPADDVKLAVGMRLGAALGPLTGFYSGYFNPLGYDRRLYMQALDLTLWRWRALPVLDRLVLGLGLLRADVSGAGSPDDYYHFASYWLLRAYAFDWLYLQYRQGLRTFGNKRNLVFDARLRGVEDGSTHNLAVAARYRGLSVTLGYFINLEKANEVDDDLARLSVAYEF